MRLGFSLIAVLLALLTPLCALGPAATASSQADETASAFEATFVRAGGGAEDIRVAVERAVTEARPLVRPIARKRLLHQNRAFEQVRFRFHEGRIAAHLGEAPPVVSPSDGTPAPYQVPGGDRAHVRQQLRGRTLVQHFRGPDGERLHRFVLSDDGTRLTYRVRVTSKYLPEPVRYTLHYRRDR